MRAIPSFSSRPDLPIAAVIGAGGVGMTIAQRLGQTHRVIIASLGEAELARAHERLHELGVVCATIPCDIADAEAVARLGEEVAKLGPVRSLAHVAALSAVNADWRSILKVNLVGAALIEKTLLPLMAEGGAGVFVSSSGGHRAAPAPEIVAILDTPLEGDLPARLEAAMSEALISGRAYSLSKWALNRMVRRKAAAWGRRKARIVSVSPGIIDTEMGAAADAEAASGKSKSAMRAVLPLGRDGAMSEIADAVEFLTSRRASYISGTDLLIDGGLVAAMHFKNAASETN